VIPRNYAIRQSCRLCSGLLAEQLDLGSTPLANELLTHTDKPQDTFPLYLSRCCVCGHVQLPVVVNPQRLFANYVYRSNTSPVFVKHLEAFARDVQPKAGGFVVEIGSNDGTLLAEYKRRGFEVLGIDPAKNIADIAESRGVPTIRAFFGRATLANWNLVGRKADLVIALNVFAHADDLGEIADGVRELLADNGTFVFEVGYLPDMIERGVYRVIYHEHLSYHHVRPLQSFLLKHGLHMYDAERVATQGGSIRCKVRKNTAAAGEVPNVSTAMFNQFVMPERDAALTDVRRLRAVIDKDRAELRTILNEARATGKTVCGYGCPAQLTTTAYALGIEHEDIDFVVDDNDLKQGKYTPGLFWPIVPTSYLVDMEPDVCVIFSGNFAADIIDRHKDFAGEWVVP
jgi:hypothetical protein